MNLRLLIVLAVLSLTACGGPLRKDDAPASDLLVLKETAKRTLAPRTLPNGKNYCAELARTEDAQDDCMGDLEAAFFKSEEDKANGLRAIVRGIDRLILARNPCGFWARTFKRDRCEVP